MIDENGNEDSEDLKYFEDFANAEDAEDAEMSDSSPTNPADEVGPAQTAHALFIEERKALIDAARESSRTFDKAILTFGSAVFGFSIAFIKDVAPHPELCTLKWLAFSWAAFASGLLAVLLSFLFSHKACMCEIDNGRKLLNDPKAKCSNRWSPAVNICNYACVGLLFFGLAFWSVFAFQNLAKGATTLSKEQPKYEKVEKGYVPPKAPPPPPKQPSQPPPPKK